MPTELPFLFIYAIIAVIVFLVLTISSETPWRDYEIFMVVGPVFWPLLAAFAIVASPFLVAWLIGRGLRKLYLRGKK